MTTKRLPGYLLKPLQNIATASTDCLSAYASLVLQSIDTDDGTIANARAQLILLNERLTEEVAKVTDTPLDDLLGILTSLQALRDETSALLPSTLDTDEEVADDADLLVRAVDAVTEVARRAAGRECLVKKIVGTDSH